MGNIVTIVTIVTGGVMILEHDVEQYLVDSVEKTGGLCVKFIPDHRSGMPDRIAMFPGGALVWVEMKRPKTGRLSGLQRHRHRELRALGQAVAVCWSREDVDALVAAHT